MTNSFASLSRANRPRGTLTCAESPYARWNLRRNPFGELTRDERGELAIVDDLNFWLQVVASPMSALQFVGDCGFGKTTHLLVLQRELPGAAYVYYPETGERPPLPCERPLIVDEAQRMGRRQERNLFRNPGPVILGTHIDFASQLTRAGFEVTTVNVERPKTAQTLAKILNRRIEASRLDEDDSLPLVDLLFAEMLLQRFGSNVRRIEHFLYDCFQLSVSECAPWPPVV